MARNPGRSARTTGPMFTKHGGESVRRLIEEQGLQRTRFALNEQSQGNADRILKRLSAFIPSNGFRLTQEELFDRYRTLTMRQLIA